MDFDFTTLPPEDRYRLLTNFVGPRPIALVTTRSADGVANAAPMSFFNVFGHDPAILALGMVMFTLGSKVIPAAELTLLSLIEVLLAPVWVFLFLGETASPGTFVGGGVLLAAVCLNAIMGAHKQLAEGLAKSP